MSIDPLRFGTVIEDPGADFGCSSRGDFESVRDMRFGPGAGALLESGAALGDTRPESGNAGELEPDTEDLLFVRRHSFLMLFTLISDDECFVAALPSSSASESTEKRLDGVSETLLIDLALCVCRREGSSCRKGRSEGNLPNGSGDKGITGESDPGPCASEGATSGG